MAKDNIKNIILTYLKKENEYPYRYRFQQDLWNYTEFSRLKDIRKYINSIKKNLIGKTLDKILFLNDLDNNIYIFKDKMWHGYNEEEKEIKSVYEPYWENIAEPPIVLQFGENNLEIDVSDDAGRCFDGPNYVRLGYNTISNLKDIEKRFKGINHSIRFKEIIGQKLVEIITEHRCNHIEFKFENGYGCEIYTDTCADYGTEFRVITPKMYAMIPCRVCAYKENANSEWTMEILQGEQTKDKFIKEHYKNKFKFWKNPISISFTKNTLKRQINNPSKLVLDMFNYYGSDFDKWIYIGDTDKFYQVNEIIPEPDIKSVNADIKINMNIDVKGIETYFKSCIDKDYLDYKIHSEIEFVVNDESIKPNIGSGAGSDFRLKAKNFIKNIENDIPSSICPFHTQQDVLFAYPKKDKLRILIRGNLLDGAKYIFDYTTDKSDFIKQLKRGIYQLAKAQYSVNKHIKEYIKENNIKKEN